MKKIFIMTIVLVFSFSLLITNIAEARGRYGSHRVGGYNSHGKGSHYIGGHVRSCHGLACR